jgi:hypothetical protein
MDYFKNNVNHLPLRIQVLSDSILNYAQDKHNRRSILGYAVTVALAYYVARTVYNVFTPPKKLRHIPRPSSTAWMRSILRGSSPSERARKFIMPLIEEHGVCLRYQMGKWVVVVADIELIKPFLRDIKTFPKKPVIFSRVSFAMLFWLKAYQLANRHMFASRISLLAILLTCWVPTRRLGNANGKQLILRFIVQCQ